MLVASQERHATVGEIDGLSRAMAATIDPILMPPGTVVGLAAEHAAGFLTGFLALRRARQTVVLLDSLAPPHERQRACVAVGAAAELTCSTSWPSSVDDFCLTMTGFKTSRQTLSDIAAIKLTSGSSGAARGVAMTEESLFADESALAATMDLRATDRLLAALPLSHSYGFTTLALSAMMRGLMLVLPSDQGPFAPLTAARELEATVFPTVPAYVQALLKVSRRPHWPARIRRVISAGAILPRASAVQFRETFGQAIHTFYGASECGGICYDREGGAAERGTVGTPVDGVRVTLEPPAGTEGLVVVESASVASGYVPEFDLRLADGRFETSDVATWQGGELALRRRADRVINLRGRKVDPSEIERVLASLDGVDEAVVVGVVSQPGGEEIIRAVVACVGGRLDYQRVTAWCRRQLADHKVPRSVIIVDAIPRTSRGKIDRAALAQLTTARDPDLAHG